MAAGNHGVRVGEGIEIRYTVRKTTRGNYIVESPDLPGCIVQARSAAAAAREFRQAVIGYLEALVHKARKGRLRPVSGKTIARDKLLISARPH